MRHQIFTRRARALTYLRALSWRAFNLLENNGDCQPATNGEKHFLDTMLAYYVFDKTGLIANTLHILDVGAYVGDYSRLILDRCSELQLPVHVHVFEPLAANFHVLQSRLDSYSNVTLNRLAVSNIVGDADIYFDAERGSLTSIYRRNLKAYHMQLTASERVQTTRLDAYINRLSLEHIPFMKLDVEGHELAVLEGMGSYLDGDFVDFLSFEYGGANLDARSSLMLLYETLEGAGFAVAKVMRNGLELRDYRPWMDNFTYANYVAVSHRVLQRMAPSFLERGG